MDKKTIRLEAETYPVYIGALTDGVFESLLTGKYASAKKIIFVDENTHDCCLEYLLTHFEALGEAEVIMLPAGEEHKNIQICIQVWEAMTEYRISRNDLAICLGGGVVTDMGGFIASLYKRGIDFIQIPTSLLAMTDAAVGGKTGVDLANYKNLLGVFSNPKAVFIDAHFLETLPVIDKIGGWMEMIKHGLIADALHFSELKVVNFHEFSIPEEVISRSLTIKNEIVKHDPFEKNIRKTLNFGHTFGHAAESFFLENTEPINHGIAVGIGIIVESYWSWRKGLLEESDLYKICSVIIDKVGLPDLTGIPAEHFWMYMLNDKKNDRNEVRTVLLKAIGTAVYDEVVSFELLQEGLEFYQRMNKE